MFLKIKIFESCYLAYSTLLTLNLSLIYIRCTFFILDRYLYFTYLCWYARNGLVSLIGWDLHEKENQQSMMFCHSGVDETS